MFQKPNYTQTPNIFFDDIAKTLKEGELRVLLVIMRQTFGWGNKEWDYISISQLMEKTGMERKAVINSAKSLSDKKIILIHKTGEKGSEKTWYSLCVEKEPEFQNFPDDSNNFNQYPKDTPPSILKIPTKETLTKEIKKIEQKKAPAASAISLNAATKKFEGISEEDVNRWQQTFPAVNVRKELQEALLWALNTPRKNYRRSLDAWMSNINKSHTTPFKQELQASESFTEEDAARNKEQGDAWEKEYEKNKSIHYDVQSSFEKITFILPNNESYSVKYNQSTKEFLNSCQKAITKMKLPSFLLKNMLKN